MNSTIEQVDQRTDQLHAHPGVGEAQRIDLEQLDTAHDPIRQQLAGAGGVRENQTALQLAQLGGVDCRIGEAAHAGVDSVHAPVLLDRPVDHRVRVPNRPACSRIEGDSGPGFRQPAGIRHRQPPRPNHECLVAHVSNHPVPLPLRANINITRCLHRAQYGRREPWDGRYSEVQVSGRSDWLGAMPQRRLAGMSGYALPTPPGWSCIGPESASADRIAVPGNVEEPINRIGACLTGHDAPSSVRCCTGGWEEMILCHACRRFEFRCAGTGRRQVR